MKCCIIMQSTVRACIFRRRYLRMRNAIYNLQRYGRGYLARRHANNLRRNRAAVTIQRYIRGWVKRVQYESLKRTIEGIQRYAKGFLARRYYMELLYTAKALTIQKYVRGWLTRRWYTKEKRKIIVCQSAIRRFLARRLYRKLKIEARSIEHVKSLNKGLENKIISLQQKLDELNKNNIELKKKETEVIDLRTKLVTFKSLEVEIKNLTNTLAQRDAKIAQLESILKNERDEKMDLVNEHDRYKQETEEQRSVWNEEMSKLRKELDNINEIVKNYEKHGEENMNARIEHEKLLILNEQDSDRHAYQKLLQEYNCLEQHCEDLERQLKEQNKHTHHTHARNISDVSSISSFADSIVTNSELPEDHGYGSVRSTSSNSQRPKLDSIDFQNESNVVDNSQTTTTTEEIKSEEKLDVGLLLKMQHKLSEVEREKNRLQKRLDDLDTSPRTERVDTSIKDSQRISELELYISTLKTHLYELQDGIEEGSGREKLVEQNKMLHEELGRRSEEIVQLKGVLAEQTNNMKTLVGSRSRTGEYINEDGELALAYETQKTINKQLELELQDEMAKYKAHEKEYKIEIEKLREDNERQQRLLADNLQVTAQTKGEAYMKHEITRLTKENLELQDKCDASADTIRKLKRQIKVLTKKMKDSGFDVDETLNDLNKQDEIAQKHGRMLPNVRKKNWDYLGMFSFKAGEEASIMRQLVIELKPRTAVTLLPGLPAYVVFMCIRHTDFINDEDKVKALLSNFTNCVKKVVKKRHEDFESVTLWLSNTLRLLHCMKQYSGDVAFQTKNTKKQNEQCLRNFDLSEYRQVLSDIAVWIHQNLIRNLEEKIQPLVVPAILEHEEIRGATGNKPAGFSRRASISARESLASPIGGNQKPTTALLQELTNHHKILNFYGVDPEVISQIFKQIFYFICASSLNNLLLRKELCHWSKGFQIRHNLSHFEMWTREKGLDEKAIHTTLEPIIQASHLLQARKTDEDVVSVCEMCSVLTPLQICKILNLYTPVDEFEQRVPVSFIRKVQAKLQEKSDNRDQQTLLMDIQYVYPVRFPFKPSDICLEDLEIPETLKLHMLEKI